MTPKFEMRKTIIFCLLVAVCLHWKQPQQLVVEAFDAPNSIVGYKACKNLILRLADCLIDASDFYLHNSQPANFDSNAQPEVQASQAKLGSWPSALAAIQDEQQRGAGANEQVAQKSNDVKFADEISAEIGVQVEEKKDDGDGHDENGFGWPFNGFGDGDRENYPSTKPMNWRQLELEKKKKEEEEEQQQKLSNGVDESRDSCWRQAIEWIKGQLLAIRMQLVLSGGSSAPELDTSAVNDLQVMRKAPSNKDLIAMTPIACALEKFHQLNEHLKDVCTHEKALGNDQIDIFAASPSFALNLEPTKEANDRLNSLNYLRETIEILAEIYEELIGKHPSKFDALPARNDGKLEAGFGINIDEVNERDEDVVDINIQAGESPFSFGSALSEEGNISSGSSSSKLPSFTTVAMEETTTTKQTTTTTTKRATSRGPLDALAAGAREKAAVELIKRHYSYLMQIITTYNLLFNDRSDDFRGSLTLT